VFTVDKLNHYRLRLAVQDYPIYGVSSGYQPIFHPISQNTLTLLCGHGIFRYLAGEI
jgi:hypothetical protein